MSNIDEKIVQDNEKHELMNELDKIEYWTAFWQQGKVIVPFWTSKEGNKRMTRQEMECLGALIPSENDELLYKEWCKKEGVEYLPPLHY